MPQTEDKKNLRDRRKLTGTQFGLNDIRTPTLHKIFAKKWGGGNERASGVKENNKKLCGEIVV